MQRSRFLSPTSLAALGSVAALAATGCSDDSCGPMGAPSSGLTASSADVTLVYGDLTFLAGNDCPAPDAPAGVVSISLEGRQTNGGTGLVTLCIPRPDLLMSGPRTLGTSLSMADIRIFDLSGEFNNCTFTFDSTRLPTGSATATGVCDDGNDPAGFALALDGAVGLRRTCGSTIDTVGVTLVGRIAVTER